MFSKLFLLLSLLLLIFNPLSCIATAGLTPRNDSSINPWTPIQNVRDPKMQNLGKFAVSEYDKTGASHLIFVKVVNGSSLHLSFFPRAEIIWWLWLQATNCSKPGPARMYETKLFEDYYQTGARNSTIKFGFLRSVKG
ncbi:hypothetical protein LUZ60_014265 [Juncus effusus]|nr:hypothetical protein LUZ60_014265 [Juncus effusus]